MPREVLPDCLEYAPSKDPARAAEYWGARQGLHADAIERAVETITELLHLQGALERLGSDRSCLTGEQALQLQAVSIATDQLVRVVVDRIAAHNKERGDQAETYRRECEALIA